MALLTGATFTLSRLGKRTSCVLPSLIHCYQAAPACVSATSHNLQISTGSPATSRCGCSSKGNSTKSRLLPVAVAFATPCAISSCNVSSVVLCTLPPSCLANILDESACTRGLSKFRVRIPSRGHPRSSGADTAVGTAFAPSLGAREEVGGGEGRQGVWWFGRVGGRWWLGRG